MLSTDGNSVMSTNLTLEFRRAKNLLKSVINNERSVKVSFGDALEMNFEGANIRIDDTGQSGEVLVRYRQMSARNQKVFAAAYRRLFEDASSYRGRFGDGAE